MRTITIAICLAAGLYAQDKPKETPKEDPTAQLAKARHEIADLREAIRQMQVRESNSFSALNGCLGFPVQVPPPEIAPENNTASAAPTK